MPHFYIDTSALLKRYHTEEGTEFVNELYDQKRSEKGHIYTSILTGAEFCSAIRRKQREKRLSESESNYIISAFFIESESMLFTIPADWSVVSLSIRLLSDYPLKAYDAVQLASGLGIREQTSKEMRDFYFICDDERLCLAAESESLKVLRPRSSAAHDELMRLRMA